MAACNPTSPRSKVPPEWAAALQAWEVASIRGGGRWEPGERRLGRRSQGRPSWAQAMEQNHHAKKEGEKKTGFWKFAQEDTQLPTMPFIYYILNSEH
jgi:hypothetical protein